MFRKLPRQARWLALACAVALPVPSPAAEPLVSLYCARGVADYPDAELQRAADGHHVVEVVFVGFQPSRVRADWSLRDCLRTAIKFDDSRDIVARLWVREREWRSPRRPQRPYGPAIDLVYKAASGRIVLQKADDGS